MVKIFKQWAHKRSINANLEEIEVESLDEVLSQFYGDIRKQDGKECQPYSLRVMQSLLHCCLSEKGITKVF